MAGEIKPFWMNLSTEGWISYIVGDNAGGLVSCDTCPCPIPPFCPQCQTYQDRPGYTQTNYLQIIGIRCDENCEAEPHLIGEYNQTEEAQADPGWVGCVWWEWTSTHCRTWYGVLHDCTISAIATERVCEEPVPPVPPPATWDGPGYYCRVYMYARYNDGATICVDHEPTSVEFKASLLNGITLERTCEYISSESTYNSYLQDIVRPLRFTDTGLACQNGEQYTVYHSPSGDYYCISLYKVDEDCTGCPECSSAYMAITGQWYPGHPGATRCEELEDLALLDVLDYDSVDASEGDI